MAELKHGVFITKFPTKCLLLVKMRALGLPSRCVWVGLVLDCERGSKDQNAGVGGTEPRSSCCRANIQVSEEFRILYKYAGIKQYLAKEK